MKGKKFIWVLVLTVVLSLAVPLAGCGQQAGDHDVMEEPEITVEYLSGEFAQQLLRDGGEEILGTVHLKEEKDGSYALTVNSMAIIESSATKGGYYVADRNVSTTVPLDSEARVTYITDTKKGPEVMDLDKFIEKVKKDGASSDPALSETKLYNVYIIGGNALMLLAKELPGQ